MKIEVWSDFVCPFCYIGKRRMEEAIGQLGSKEPVEIIYKSFELDQNAPLKYEGNIHELISKKYGIPVSQAKASNVQIVEQAKTVGLNYDFDNIKPTNTLNAHRLAHFAAEKDKAEVFTEALLSAYFENGKDLSDKKQLATIAKTCGLDYDEAMGVLESEAYKAEVRKDESEASRLGIRGVPYFVINEKYGISGAQPVSVFLNSFKEAIEEEREKPLTELGTQDQGICVDGQCKF